MRIFLTAALSFCVITGLTNCAGGLFGSRAPVTLNQAWASERTLRTPESVILDRDRNVLYVSNINGTSDIKRKDGDGFISKMSPTGQVEELYWVSGLNDPKGLALHNNVLYVADLDEIVAISTQTGAVLGKYKADRAEFLNDVAVDENGNVFVTDSQRRRIYQLRNGQVSTWLDKTKQDRPNGLFVDGNRMIVAFSGSGSVHFVDPETKKLTDWVDKIPRADGITRARDGGFFISSWNGEIYYVNEAGKKWLLLDTKGQNMNTADIYYSESLNMLFVPTYSDNRVVAYNVAY